jgi:hypothetical protein
MGSRLRRVLLGPSLADLRQAMVAAVSSYTVTIRPDSGPAAMQATRIVVRINTGLPRARIVEMGLSSSAPEGLVAAQILDIDLQAVLQALRQGLGEALGPSDARSPKTAESESNSVRSDVEPVADRARNRAGQLDAATGSAAESRSGRAYRRMPAAEELRATYEQIGTVTGVAKHYGVPRHTAQGWMARIRKLAAASEQQSDPTLLITSDGS